MVITELIIFHAHFDGVPDEPWRYKQVTDFRIEPDYLEFCHKSLSGPMMSTSIPRGMILSFLVIL